MITRNGASVGWRSDNLPSVINAAGYSAQFDYGPDGQRWRQVSSYASGNETTIYVAGLLEKLTTPVRTHWKHLIPTPSGQVQHLRRSDGTSETLYLPTEHLGSVDAVLDAGGAVLARPSFTAWGARRSSSWSGAPSSGEWQAIANTNRRGYTGHEQLDNVMLVHMNGRVYDPAIGRFLSADPYVESAHPTQGWNRYSYVVNAPLLYTDPSGHSLEEIIIEAHRWRRMMLEWLNAELIRSLSLRRSIGGGGGMAGGTLSVVNTVEDNNVNEIPPCTEELDTDSNGAVTAGGYPGGVGGEMTVGKDTGNSYVTLRAGFGLLGGASYDRGARIPGPEPLDRGRGGTIISVTARFDFNVGPVSVGTEFGAARNWTDGVSDWTGDPFAVSFNPDAKGGLSLSASLAGQLTVYGAQVKYYSDQGTCRL